MGRSRVGKETKWRQRRERRSERSRKSLGDSLFLGLAAGSRVFDTKVTES